MESTQSKSIPLATPTFDVDEIMEAIDSLLRKQVTMGEKVQRFERKFADYVGCEHAVMVNSGSSANLLAAKILANRAIENRIEPGEEVIVPALGWSTTLFPFLDIGARPVLVDVTLDNFCIDIDRVREAITDDTAAVMIVHAFGYPANMDALLELVDDHDLYLIEDSCEALGAQYRDAHVGTIGDIGTFSFYFSHHISTIEGGMLVTDSDQYADLARILRAHGWSRDLPADSPFQHDQSGIDDRFRFVNTGYNLRPTEIQGAFGIHQIEKLEGFIQRRRENAQLMTKALSEDDTPLRLPTFEPREEGNRSTVLGYPMMTETKSQKERLTTHLEANGIETRPMIAGNLGRHPFVEHYGEDMVVNDTSNADDIMETGLFIGAHHEVTPDDIEHLKATVSEVFNG